MSTNNPDETRNMELRSRVTAIQSKTAKDYQEARDFGLAVKVAQDEIRDRKGTP